MDRTAFEERLHLLQAAHEALLSRRNEVDPNWYNGLFDRYRYPILTADHTPLTWRYDLNPATNPYLMERLGILPLRHVFPGQLSGGELRRMAIARALAAEPDFIFADEPTGDLDDENTAAVLSLLRETARAGAAILMVTHEADAASCADRLWRMDGGILRREEPPAP